MPTKVGISYWNNKAMTMQSGIIQFADSAQEELSLLSRELRLSNLVHSLDPAFPIPDAVKDDIRQLLITVSDLFSVNLPALEDNPFDTLRLASRDINLSRVLRERGLFRLYRLLNEQITLDETDPFTNVTERVTMPIFQTLQDPETHQNFKRREEFLIWFCKNAHVSRSTVFMRIATIEKVLSLGKSLEQAFTLITAAPSAMRDALYLVGDWDGGDLVNVNLDAAPNLARKFLPETQQRVEQLTAVLKDKEADPEARQQAQAQLSDTLRPAIARMVEEVAANPNIKDAMDFVRHDIAAKPEVKYRWDYDRDELEVEVMRKKLDATGTEYVAEIVKLKMIADPGMPVEARLDLIRRLPITNRIILDS